MPHQQLKKQLGSHQFDVAKPRFFNDSEHSVYLLPADSEEGQRLNLQHANLVYAAQGRLLFAPIQLQSGHRVLDCATGTGIWLLDLLSKSPTGVTFTGVDMSPHLFPAADATPANASFLRQSILDLPDHWESSYDVVHQRLLIAALRTEEWPEAIKSCFRVLRQGGWMQLCEVYPLGCMSIGPHTARVRDMQRQLMLLKGLDIECALHLEGWAREAGLVNIEKVCINVPVGARIGKGPKNYTDACVGMFLAMKRPMTDAGVVKTEEEYFAAVFAMREEWDNMDDAHVPFYWVWAQKPTHD